MRRRQRKKNRKKLLKIVRSWNEGMASRPAETSVIDLSSFNGIAVRLRRYSGGLLINGQVTSGDVLCKGGIG